jgi:Transposase IS116/IS110/IS902 family
MASWLGGADCASGVKREPVLLIAEIGVDLSAFPTLKRVASWLGCAPGNDESAGKRRSLHRCDVPCPGACCGVGRISIRVGTGNQ